MLCVLLRCKFYGTRFSRDVTAQILVGAAMNVVRPSSVREHGVEGASALLRERLEAAVDSVPDCRGKQALKAMIQHEASSLLANALNARRAA